jgi:hypothetical protein
MKTQWTLSIFAAAALLASSPARAEPCQVVAAVGSGPTDGIAQLMSTKGLENIIEGKGMKGQGPVKTKCEAGAIMIECRSQQKACK